MTDKHKDKKNIHGKKHAGDKLDNYVLKLYVAGLTSRSSAAIQSIRQTCEEYLAGHYEIEVINIIEHPKMARSEQIIAAPTLIKKLPLPLRRLIGDMTDKDKVLAGLDLIVRAQTDEGGHDAP